MSTKVLDMEIYAGKARQMAAEGCVLLKNENQALPLGKHDKVAVFGRCALHYYKSGLGSGGLVNTSYVVSILDALKERSEIQLNQELMDAYKAWEEENPIDQGHGWGTVPWSQKEMPVTEDMIHIASKSDAAIVIIGRTAGEDQDNRAEAGSYLLTESELDMIRKVSQACKRTIVLLNVGNQIDMKWVAECNPAAVMYVWQGGQEGGHGVADVLLGDVTPCGRLTDTIAKDITDYPSTMHFGDKHKNIYEEDIFVGYRYFETFAKDSVLYPFGYGLSYTTFSMQSHVQEVTEDEVVVKTTVTNTGNLSGKEVVQIYVAAPQGVLGKPERVLAGFAKTKALIPGESQTLTISCQKSSIASYDDSDVQAFVLEAGSYQIYVGKNVRECVLVGEWQQEYRIVEQCQEACAPVEEFQRFHRTKDVLIKETSPMRKENLEKKIQSFRKQEIPYTGNQGDVFKDVAEKKISMKEFIAQLSDEDLMALFHGEGMCSTKVTPGTASAFGGVTESLRLYGIPIACCADGPSGIRMDCGAIAFSLPNGTAIGCSFNTELAEDLFAQLGRELLKNRIDTLLGPGINIHRNPLNGRNFEYCSEDPLLTGLMCAAQLKGLHKEGTSGTIKHFCGNNQEHYRTQVESVVSQRALREIYLKGFEIAVKEGNARSIMTSYNPVNGIWAAGNYDLNTTILREDWGFEGIVMTDWWASGNWEHGEADKTNRAPMVLAQNDLYMVCSDAAEELHIDNVASALKEGKITRSDLQRNADNILTFILKSQAMRREMGVEEEIEVVNGSFGMSEEDSNQVIERYLPDEATGNFEMKNMPIVAHKGESVVFQLDEMECKEYDMVFEIKSDLSELAQLPISLYIDNIYRSTLSFQGTNGSSKTVTHKFELMFGSTHYLKLYFAADGIEIQSLKLIVK